MIPNCACVFVVEAFGRPHVFGVQLNGLVYRLVTEELVGGHERPGPHVRWEEVRQAPMGLL